MTRPLPVTKLLEALPNLSKKDLNKIKVRCDLLLGDLSSADEPRREEAAFYSVATRLLLENGDTKKYSDYSLFKRNNPALSKNLSSLIGWMDIWVTNNLESDKEFTWEDKILFFRFYCKVCISIIIMVEKCPLGLRPLINFGRGRFLRYLELSFPSYISSGVWKLAAHRILNKNMGQ